MKPEFPLFVIFQGGSEWVLDSPTELEVNLEWFDSEDGDKSATVRDALGRPVRIRVEAFKLLLCELE
jgi:hypothetical protein